MIVPPRGLVNFAAGVMSARMVRRLRRVDPGHAAQRRAFARLTGRLAATAFGRETGLAAGLPYETFRTRVSLRTYETLGPYLERMKRGEPGVLWPGRCSFLPCPRAPRRAAPNTCPSRRTCWRISAKPDSTRCSTTLPGWATPGSFSAGTFSSAVPPP